MGMPISASSNPSIGSSFSGVSPLAPATSTSSINNGHDSNNPISGTTAGSGVTSEYSITGSHTSNGSISGTSSGGGGNGNYATNASHGSKYGVSSLPGNTGAVPRSGAGGVGTTDTGLSLVSGLTGPSSLAAGSVGGGAGAVLGGPTVSSSLSGSRHPLHFNWVFWFMHRAPGSKILNYESAMKKIATFGSVRNPAKCFVSYCSVFLQECRTHISIFFFFAFLPENNNTTNRRRTFGRCILI